MCRGYCNRSVGSGLLRDDLTAACLGCYMYKIGKRKEKKEKGERNEQETYCTDDPRWFWIK